MATFIYTGATRFADADAKKASAVGAVHTRVLPAEETVIVYTEPDSLAQMVPISRVITTEAFRDRFTPAELLAIVASADAQIKYALLKLSTKEQPLVDLDNPEVIATMDRLVTLSLVTAARKTAILS
jgi:hypothetical protein